MSSYVMSKEKNVVILLRPVGGRKNVKLDTFRSDDFSKGFEIGN